MAIFHSALEGENSVLLSRSLSAKMTDLTSIRRLLLSKLYIQKVRSIFLKVRKTNYSTRNCCVLLFHYFDIIFVSFFSALQNFIVSFSQFMT